MSCLARFLRMMAPSGPRLRYGVFLFLVVAASNVAVAEGEVWVYHAHWMGDVWRQYDLGKFRRVLFFAVTSDADGHLTHHGWPDEWGDLRREARDRQVPIDPVVSIIGQEEFKAIFGRPAARQRLLSELASLMEASPESGVHLDVEVFDLVQPQELAGFHAFLAQLRQAMNGPRRRMLTAFVPLSAGLYRPEDLALLDGVVAQGYDLHWMQSDKAGPVAALDDESGSVAWRQAAALLEMSGVAREHIYFASPLYGYEWPTVSGDARAATRGLGHPITFAPVPIERLTQVRTNALMRSLQFGVQRDKATAAPWYAFRDADGWWQGWFDDPLSLAPRLDFVRRGGFGGVAFFVLGYDGGALVESALSVFSAAPKDEAAPTASPATNP